MSALWVNRRGEPIDVVEDEARAGHHEWLRRLRR